MVKDSCQDSSPSPLTEASICSSNELEPPRSKDTNQSISRPVSSVHLYSDLPMRCEATDDGSTKFRTPKKPVLRPDTIPESQDPTLGTRIKRTRAYTSSDDTPTAKRLNTQDDCYNDESDRVSKLDSFLENLPKTRHDIFIDKDVVFGDHVRCHMGGQLSRLLKGAPNCMLCIGPNAKAWSEAMKQTDSRYDIEPVVIEPEVSNGISGRTDLADVLWELPGQMYDLIVMQDTQYWAQNIRKLLQECVKCLVATGGIEIQQLGTATFADAKTQSLWNMMIEKSTGQTTTSEAKIWKCRLQELFNYVDERFYVVDFCGDAKARTEWLNFRFEQAGCDTSDIQGNAVLDGKIMLRVFTARCPKNLDAQYYLES